MALLTRFKTAPLIRGPSPVTVAAFVGFQHQAHSGRTRQRLQDVKYLAYDVRQLDARGRNRFRPGIQAKHVQITADQG